MLPLAVPWVEVAVWLEPSALTNFVIVFDLQLRVAISRTGAVSHSAKVQVGFCAVESVMPSLSKSQSHAVAAGVVVSVNWYTFGATNTAELKLATIESVRMNAVRVSVLGGLP